MAKDKLIDIEIVTPQKTVFSGKAQSITLPGSVSPFQVLYNHAPIVSSLELGHIKIVDQAGNSIYYATSDGFTEVSKNVVSVLVENADEASSIDVAQLNEQLKELRDSIDKSKKDEVQDKLKLIKMYENKLKIADKA